MTAEDLVRALIKQDMTAKLYVLNGGVLSELAVVAKNHIMKDWVPPQPIIILSAHELTKK